MFPFVSDILSEFILLVWIFYAELELILVGLFFRGSRIMFGTDLVAF